MSALHLKKDDFKKIIKEFKIPVFIDFFAPWCGPCRLAGPVVDELALEYKDKVAVAKVNVDEEQELAQKYGVMSIPMVIMFKDGKEIDRKTGFPGKDGFVEMIKKAL